MKSLTAFLILIALTNCATSQRTNFSGAAFDELLAFEDPATCTESPQLSDFFESLTARRDPNVLAGAVRNTRGEWDFEIGRVEVPDNLRGAVSETELYGPIFDPNVARLQEPTYHFVIETRGTWKGFPIKRIRRIAFAGGDWGGFAFDLDAPIEAVTRRLQADGFPVVGGGSVALQSDGLQSFMFLTPSDRSDARVTFGCGHS